MPNRMAQNSRKESVLRHEIRKSIDIRSSKGFYVLLHRDEKNDILFH